MSPIVSRVLVTGSRDWPEDRIGDIGEHLQPIAARDNRITLVHGGARGVDTLAASLWSNWGVLWQEKVDAPWGGPCLGPHRVDPLTGEPWCQPGHRRPRRNGGDYCPMAGYRRNQEMVRRGADVAFAFILNGSDGALDCARRAEHAGIPTTRVELDL